MARTGRHKPVKDEKTAKTAKCYFCRKKMHCYKELIGNIGRVWVCGGCLGDREFFGNESSNQTPYATNGSPNEGMPVQAMGTMKPLPYRKRTSRWEK